MNPEDSPEKQALEQERSEILQQLEDWLDGPMMVLGFVWLGLLVVELIWGLTPLLAACGTLIWGLFILDFLVEITLAPRKLRYLQRNWLLAASLLIPGLRGLRVFRFLRLTRAVGSIRLLRVVTSVNRGMRSLRASMDRRGFGYVVLLSAIVILVGAAGMYAFERGAVEGVAGLNTYGTALWWTAMLMTTLGSEYWPQTPEGRLLCFLLSLYAFAVFGYVTATLATFFIGRDAEDETAELAGAKSVAALRTEIAALRAQLQAGGHTSPNSVPENLASPGEGRPTD